MLDCYLEGSAGRLCREAPVPIVDCRLAHGRARRRGEHGAQRSRRSAARVASSRSSATTRKAALVCDALDACGRRYRSRAARSPAGGPSPSTRDRRRLSSSCGSIRATTCAVDPDVEQVLIDRLRRAGGWLRRRRRLGLRLRHSDAGRDPRARLAAGRAAPRPRRRRAQPAGLPRAAADRGEAELRRGDRLLGVPARRRARSARRTDGRARASGSSNSPAPACAAVTLDAEGAVMFERGRAAVPDLRAADAALARGRRRRHVRRDAGAALAAGANTPSAAELASAAAAVVVGKDGTSTCSASELRAYLTAEDEGDPPISTCFARRAELLPRPGTTHRLHERLLRHPPSRPHRLPQPGEGARRRADRRRQQRRQRRAG